MLPDAHYLIEVRAFNGAGLGPPGEHCEMFTKRPRKSILKVAKLPPKNIEIIFLDIFF